MTAVVSAPAAQAADWLRCPGCGCTNYAPRLTRELDVCPECGHHNRIGALERIDQLVDTGSFVRSTAEPRSADPLGFTDSKPYVERLARARAATGLADAVVCGRARVKGHAVVIAAMDFAFLGGSMGSAVGEAVTRAAETALAERIPLLIVATSGGARMQEGALSLMQMAKTAQALRGLSAAGVLSICVLAGPTFGGVTASFATLADILIGEQGALIGFAGPRVIANATRETLPEGFQTAEYLHGKGMLDRVETRKGLRPLLGRLLAVAAANPVRLVGEIQAPAPNTRTAAETLRLARDIGRPTTRDYLDLIATDFIELGGDRCARDDPAVIGGPALVAGRWVMAIGHQKGHDTAELVSRNFGMPHPEGYRKVLRLARLADRLNLPIVTLVDTQGAAPGVGAEERGQAWAVAECIAGMSEVGVPVVSVITGEGGSGGALALAVANRVLMLENTCYSVISPESCSTILFGDPSHSVEVAESLRVTPTELLRLGVVDGVIAEPEGGAQRAPDQAAAALRAAVLATLDELGGLSRDELREHRHKRFRGMGVTADG